MVGENECRRRRFAGRLMEATHCSFDEPAMRKQFAARLALLVERRSQDV